MSHRPNPRLYKTVTDEDGNVYQLTVIANAEGDVITPASSDDVEHLLSGIYGLLSTLLKHAELITGAELEHDLES